MTRTSSLEFAPPFGTPREIGTDSAVAAQTTCVELKVHLSNDGVGCVRSLARALGILNDLCTSRGSTLSDIAKRLDLPLSTAHRLLSTMQALRYVRFDRKTMHWSVGVQVLNIAAAFTPAKEFGRSGTPIMRSLVSRTHHTVNFAMPKQDGLYYVSQVVAPGAPKIVAPREACLPFHSTACGKALMACWSNEDIDRFLLNAPLASRTSRTVTKPGPLRKELDHIRRSGFAVDDEENEFGWRCVAAAVSDAYGEVRGSISLSDSSMRMPRDQLQKLGLMVATAAREMSSGAAELLPPP